MSHGFRSTALIALSMVVPALATAVQLPDSGRPGPSGPSVGVLIVAHGGGPDWNQQVEDLARVVQVPGPVTVTFLMGPGAAALPFQDAVGELVHRGASEIVVVPLFMSSHSGHYEQVRFLTGATDSLNPVMLHHLEASGIRPWTGGTPLRLTTALDDAGEVAQVLAARARGLATQPDSQALFIVAHGPNSAEDYAWWMENLRAVAAEVRRETGFRSVLVDMVRDDAPDGVRTEAVTRIRELITLQSELTGRPVVVVPALIATGRTSRQTFAKDLDGLPVTYSGEALLPGTTLARWVERQVTAQVARN